MKNRTIQPGPRLWKFLRAQSANWVQDQNTPGWDFFLGIVALICAFGTIVLAGAVIAAVLDR